MRTLSLRNLEASSCSRRARPGERTISVLEPYFERASVQPSSITETGFELLIGLWLADLIDMDELPEAYSRDNGWLIQSGLFGAIRHGIIAVEAVV